MSIPSTGPVSFQQLAAEFGDADSIGLNEFYAGGGLVGARATGVLGAVPASGSISLGHFRGSASSLMAGARFAAISPIYQTGSAFILPVSGSLAYAFDSSGVGKSTDGGFTWVRKTFVSGMTGKTPLIKSVSYYGGAIYMVATTFSSPYYNYYLMKSIDDGQNWTQVQVIVTESAVVSPMEGTVFGVRRLLYGTTIHSSGYYTVVTLMSTSDESAWDTAYINTATEGFGTYPTSVVASFWWPGCPVGVAEGGDGCFVVILTSSSAGKTKCLTSPNGITWTARPLEDQAGNSINIYLSSSTCDGFIFQGKAYVCDKYQTAGAGRDVLESVDGSKFVLKADVLPAATATMQHNSLSLSPSDDYVAYGHADGVYVTTDMTTFTKVSGIELTGSMNANQSLIRVGSYWIANYGSKYWYAPV